MTEELLLVANMKNFYKHQKVTRNYTRKIRIMWYNNGLQI